MWFVSASVSGNLNSYFPNNDIQTKSRGQLYLFLFDIFLIVIDYILQLCCKIDVNVHHVLDKFCIDIDMRLQLGSCLLVHVCVYLCFSADIVE